jgi:trehalose 6-phosphate phosphatase
MPSRPDPDRAIAAFTTALRSGVVARQCGFFFDFDGTLAPIQLDPAAVAPVPGVAARLEELAQLAGVVALVSGRPARFLAAQFENIANIRYFGLYGLETATGTAQIHTHGAAQAYQELMAAVGARAEAELPADVTVESKQVTVALHYRGAPHREDQVAAWARATALAHGLTVQPGRMVHELKPPDTPTKGSVVLDEAKNLRFAWCFGDDLGDVAAFQSLREIEATTPGFRCALVAIHNPESGAELTSLSDLVLSAPSEVPGLLDRILDALRH